MKTKKEKIKTLYDPGNFCDGFWLIKDNGNSRELMANKEDLKPKQIPLYSRMCEDRNELATFISAKFRQYFSDTLVITGEGSFRYTMPSSSNIALEILQFLSSDEEGKQEKISKAIKKSYHIDSEGHVIDSFGKLIYMKGSKEAIAHTIQEKERDIAYLEEQLGEKCIEDLNEKEPND